jgi:hypothetical protein
MNKWRCDYPGCINSCVGMGSAVGLRAVGWFFAFGTLRPIMPPQLLCPTHRRDLDLIPCLENREAEPCGSCAIAQSIRPMQESLRTADEPHIVGPLA